MAGFSASPRRGSTRPARTTMSFARDCLPAGLVMMKESLGEESRLGWPYNISPEKPKKASKIDERKKKDSQPMDSQPLPEEDDMMIPCDMLHKEVHARENCGKLCDNKARLRCKEFAKWRKKNPDVKL